MATEREALRQRLLHALLAVLLLLATTGAALHPYALDEHPGGHPCSVCVASANAGAAPLPAAFTLALPVATAPRAVADVALPVAHLPASYRARAPPV
ncbi:MAG TPA: hypothetical protein PJ986_12100 [Gammaproteobacteria bacterium]|nr:hypothetical protein [Gammaproteobacteria bacterium]